MRIGANSVGKNAGGRQSWITVESDRKSGREGGEGAMSDAKPKLPDLSLELEDLTWSETVKFGVQLDMKFPVLERIGEDKTDDLRLLAAMYSWLQSDPKASWKKVVRALRAIRKEVLAQELEEKYCRDGGSEPPAPRGGCDRSIARGNPSVIGQQI